MNTMITSKYTKAQMIPKASGLRHESLANESPSRSEQEMTYIAGLFNFDMSFPESPAFAKTTLNGGINIYVIAKAMPLKASEATIGSPSP